MTMMPTTTTTTTIRMNSWLLLVILLLCLLDSDHANVLRGGNGKTMEALKERVLHPKLPSEDHRGKTWKELGVNVQAEEEYRRRQQQERRTQSTVGLPTFGDPTFSYFAVRVDAIEVDFLLRHPLSSSSFSCSHFVPLFKMICPPAAVRRIRPRLHHAGRHGRRKRDHLQYRRSTERTDGGIHRGFPGRYLFVGLEQGHPIVHL